MEAHRPIKRRRSREDPAERRRKDRQRKRLKRAPKTAEAPVVDNSSTETEDEGNTAETGGFHHPESYLFQDAGGAACRALEGVAGGSREGPPQGFRGEAVSEASTPPTTEPDLRADSDVAEQQSGNRNPTETLAYNATYSSGGEGEVGAAGGALAEPWSGGDEREGDEGRPGNTGDSAREGGAAEDTENPPTRGQGEEGAPNGAENPRNPQDFFNEPANPTELLAMALAGVRGSSEVSDSAINKMLKVALEHKEALESLGRHRSKKKLYTQRLRPRALRHIPRVFTVILLEEKVQGGLAHRRLEDLPAIPKEYVNLPPRGKLQIIREESYVKLRDIKEHHRRIHRARGTSEEELRNHYGNAAISVDGVEEGNKCKTTFHVVTVRLGTCIYLYKIFNPLVGHKVASPSVQEVLG